MNESLLVLISLAAAGLVAGIGITAVGPGGVLATAALVLLTGLTPAEVAGTAIVTHVATGLLGSAAYWRSGQLSQPVTRRTAALLGASALVGTPLGVLINLELPGRAFGGVLACFLVLVAMLLVARADGTGGDETRHPEHPSPLIFIGGAAVAVASGMFGIGGPLLTVPLLVAVGTPVLPALAAAQAQSVVISCVGTVGYLHSDSIHWGLAFVVGIPELCGVLIGWRIAHRTSPRRLRMAMVAALLLVAPFVALRG